MFACESVFVIADAAFFAADVDLDRTALVIKSGLALCVVLLIVFSLFSKYLMAKAMQTITKVVVSFLENKKSSMRTRMEDTYT